MTIISIKSGMSRIADASPQSPIAVFKRPVGFQVLGREPLAEPKLDYVFARTVSVSAAIRRGDPYLIGVYDSSQDLNKIEIKLRALARQMHS